MKTLHALTLCTALATSGAFAQAYSASYDDITRVRRVEYKDNLVLRAVGYPDHPIMLELDPTEPIADAAGGKIAKWEISKLGSRFFARPLDGARDATVLIVTKSRSYVLDLVPGSAKGAPADFVSKIVMTYPVEKTPDLALEAQVMKDAATPLSEALKGVRNEQYSMEVVSETVDIKPREVFDDGRFTYFKFPQNLPIPAIFKSTPGSNDEWLTNSHRDNDYVVVHGVGAAWNLRLSGSVVGIFNDAFDATGNASVNGTTIRGLQQELRR
ncbi:TrbG/VirB9 family P-type conjugative transfer protein [Variovorax ginsengisoli]|uniref:Type IV secretion system protein VirB9 n=1 Tax=Variovorax ginsengisoli TaxID=363844 RepID=A0ABT9SG97_9BURK|nr:TrbG/VirB9 family P-type conjugative transfer protein [Variovorax ginsengisoli]MDP9902392.1 type IV secretion system protein VirB9 [Variovorax ginsengisoli]